MALELELELECMRLAGSDVDGRCLSKDDEVGIEFELELELELELVFDENLVVILRENEEDEEWLFLLLLVGDISFDEDLDLFPCKIRFKSLEYLLIEWEWVGMDWVDDGFVLVLFLLDDEYLCES